MKKTFTTKLLVLFLGLFLTFSLSSCSSNDDDSLAIVDEQGKLELTPENVGKGFFKISKWTTENTHSFSNGLSSNSLLDVNVNKELIGFSSKSTINIYLPFINEDGKVDLAIQEGSWKATSDNRIHVYNLTDGLSDIILENFSIERIGNRENEIYNISFNYYDPVLKENVTIYATKK